jgi:hypothetical protein
MGRFVPGDNLEITLALYPIVVSNRNEEEIDETYRGDKAENIPIKNGTSGFIGNSEKVISNI